MLVATGDSLLELLPLRYRRHEKPKGSGSAVNQFGPCVGGHALQQAEYSKDHKDLNELEPVPRAHLGLDESAGGASLCRCAGYGGEAASGLVLLHEGILLVPLLAQPHVKFVVIVEGQVGDFEASPVKVHRLWRPALEVRAREGEVFLPEVAAASMITQSISNW